MTNYDRCIKINNAENQFFCEIKKAISSLTWTLVRKRLVIVETYPKELSIINNDLYQSLVKCDSYGRNHFCIEKEFGEKYAHIQFEFNPYENESYTITCCDKNDILDFISENNIKVIISEKLRNKILDRRNFEDKLFSIINRTEDELHAIRS